MKALKITLVSSLLAAGCACTLLRSQPTNAENQTPGNRPVAEAEATPGTTPVPAPTVSQDTPEALLRDLYKVHGDDMKSASRDRIMGGKSRALLDKYFEKKLADLIWTDLTTHEGEIGVIDWDIFYDTQDPQIKNVVVAPAAVSGDTATVKVTFTNYTTRDTVTYLMAKENAKWKIHDIKYAGGHTLLGAFEEDAKARKENAKSDN